MSTRTLSGCLLAALALTTLVGDARAQALDDVWFKVTLNVNAGALTTGGDLEKAKGKVTAYLRVVPAVGAIAGGDEGALPTVGYDFESFCEVDPGVWESTGVGSFLTAGSNEDAMIGTDLSPDSCGIPLVVRVPDEDSSELNVLFVARLKLKFDKQAQLKSAKFNSSGALISFGTGGEDLLVGGVKLKGKLIPIEKLPFSLDS